MEIKRDQNRIDSTGEIFTPIELVDEILDKLPKKAFDDPEKTFCDPACGDGNFLFQILKRKIEKGHDPLTALSTIYGVDIMKDNVAECRKRLWTIATEGSDDIEFKKQAKRIVKKNIVCADGLTYDYSFVDKNKGKK